MRLAFRYAARTDVGSVRERNDDSGCAGPRLIAVADGMGGAVGGDVASAITIDTIQGFDPANHTDPVHALAAAAIDANQRIGDRIQVDPHLDGMGTTLTALLLYGERDLGLVHIGDSRAYLLRDGTLRQLSHDHTFVQSLIDEGRLTEEQAKRHPHRALITRAMQGLGDTEPDVGTMEAEPGDWLLVCSDGLVDAPVPDERIAETLQADPDPDRIAVELLRMALRAGGPDNVTVAVAEVIDLDATNDNGAGSAAALTGASVVGAASNPDLAVQPEPTQAQREAMLAESDDRPDELAELDHMVSVLPAEPEETLTGSQLDAEEAEEQLRYAPRPPSRFRWVLRGVLALVIVGLIGFGGKLAYDWTQRQFYVGANPPASEGAAKSDEEVAIYRGIAQNVPGVELSSIIETKAGLTLDRLPALHQQRVEETITVDDLAHAKRLVAQLERIADECEPGETGTDSGSDGGSSAGNGSNNLEPGGTSDQTVDASGPSSECESQ